MGRELKLIDDENKVKCTNNNDEAHGLIRKSITPDLMFQLQGINDPGDAWEKLENMFGKHNII
jgi:hypothetical protein